MTCSACRWRTHPAFVSVLDSQERESQSCARPFFIRSIRSVSLMYIRSTTRKIYVGYLASQSERPQRRLSLVESAREVERVGVDLGLFSHANPNPCSRNTLALLLDTLIERTLLDTYTDALDWTKTTDRRTGWLGGECGAFPLHERQASNGGRHGLGEGW